MAARIMDSDFLLPNDFFMPEKKPQMQDPNDVPANPKQKKDFFCFPDEFPYDYDDYDSSITETEESDEEDPSYNLLAAALTQKMAHSFILNQDDNTINKKSPHAQVSSNISFPPSTLQPNTADTNLRNTVKDCQDLLFRHHGVAEKMRRKVVGAPRPPNDSSVSTGVYYPNPALTHRQLQVNQFHELKHQQMLRLQQQCSAAWGSHNRARGGFGIVNNNHHDHVANGRPLGLSSSARPPLQQPRHIQQQQQQGSGMRAVFLGAPNTGKPTCGGTGVFLPRCAGAPNDVPKKPSCSTVLLPARVVQALNLNLEDLGPPGRFPVSFVLDHDRVTARNSSSNPAMMSQKKGLRRQAPPGSMNTHYELRLPQEWSY